MFRLVFNSLFKRQNRVGLALLAIVFLAASASAAPNLRCFSQESSHIVDFEFKYTGGKSFYSVYMYLLRLNGGLSSIWKAGASENVANEEFFLYRGDRYLYGLSFTSETVGHGIVDSVEVNLSVVENQMSSRRRSGRLVKSWQEQDVTFEGALNINHPVHGVFSFQVTCEFIINLWVPIETRTGRVALIINPEALIRATRYDPAQPGTIQIEMPSSRN